MKIGDCYHDLNCSGVKETKQSESETGGFHAPCMLYVCVLCVFGLDEEVQETMPSYQLFGSKSPAS